LDCHQLLRVVDQTVEPLVVLQAEECLLQVAALVARLQVVVARVELKVVLLVQVAPEEEVNELFF
jgi:hypothetical protein